MSVTVPTVMMMCSRIDGRQQCHGCHRSNRPRHIRRQLRLILTTSRTPAGRTRTGTVLSTGVHEMTAHGMGCGRTWTVLSTDVHGMVAHRIEPGRTRTWTVLSTEVHMMTTYGIGCGKTWTILSTYVHGMMAHRLESGRTRTAASINVSS